MTYKVNLDIGTGKNRTIMQSISLPSKSRVEKYIKRNPMIKSNTRIRVYDSKRDKTITATRGRFTKNPVTNKFRF